MVGREKDEKKAYDRVYNRYIKRVLDFTITGIALCFLWPLYLIVALAIALEDGMPVFYRAERGGYMGKPFKICKFRSMVKNAEKIGGGTTALHDPRITKIGNILRKTKLDEIPQIGQVFLGDRGIIGTTKKNIDFQALSRRKSALFKRFVLVGWNSG